MMKRASRVAPALLAAILIAVPLAARDRSKVPSPEGSRLKPVPLDAIKIPLPDIQQDDESSCGAASLMSICMYYNVGPGRLADYKRILHTDPEYGTYYDDIRKYAAKLGLDAEVKFKLTPDDLKTK